MKNAKWYSAFKKEWKEGMKKFHKGEWNVTSGHDEGVYEGFVSKDNRAGVTICISAIGEKLHKIYHIWKDNKDILFKLFGSDVLELKGWNEIYSEDEGEEE